MPAFSAVMSVTARFLPVAPAIVLPLSFHWYCKLEPVASTERVNEPPAATVTEASGCTVMRGGITDAPLELLEEDDELLELDDELELPAPPPLPDEELELLLELDELELLLDDEDEDEEEDEELLLELDDEDDELLLELELDDELLPGAVPLVVASTVAVFCDSFPAASTATT